MAMSGRAVIDDGVIIMRLPVKNLPSVVEGSWAAGIEEYQEQKHDRNRSLFFLAGMRFPS